MSPRVSAALKLDALGTTFGGGPMACAVIEAVIEAIESEHLLENVRSVAALIRSRCLVGPVIGQQGAGLLVGLRTAQPAKQVARRAARARHPGRHQRRPGHPAAAAALRAGAPPCRAAARCAARHRRLRTRTACDDFIDLADFSREQLLGAARARAAPGGAPRAARAGRQGARPAVHESLAAHAGLVPGRHGAPGRLLIRDHAGQRHLAD